MKTIVKTIAVATSFATTTIAPVKANAAIETLADCYKAVITWCNETYPDMDCSQSSGLDECDEVFGDKYDGLKLDQIIAGVSENGRPQLQFHMSAVEEEPQPNPRRSRDRDDDDDNEDRQIRHAERDGNGIDTEEEPQAPANENEAGEAQREPGDARDRSNVQKKLDDTENAVIGKV